MLSSAVLQCPFVCEARSREFEECAAKMVDDSCALHFIFMVHVDNEGCRPTRNVSQMCFGLRADNARVERKIVCMEAMADLTPGALCEYLQLPPEVDQDETDGQRARELKASIVYTWAKMQTWSGVGDAGLGKICSVMFGDGGMQHTADWKEWINPGRSRSRFSEKRDQNTRFSKKRDQNGTVLHMR